MLKNIIVASALWLVTASAWAGCDEVKAMIDEKIKAKGVVKYNLTVIPKDQAADGKVVGHCEGGAKVIVYKRG